MPEAVHKFVALGVVVGLLLPSLAAWSLLGWSLWPRHADAVRARLEETARHAFLLGLLNVVLACGVVALLKAPPIALLFLVTGFAATLAGLPALAALVGERLLQFAGREPSRLASVVAGVVAIGFASMVPLFGQALGIGMLIATLGASLSALLHPPRA